MLDLVMGSVCHILPVLESVQAAMRNNCSVHLCRMIEEVAPGIVVTLDDARFHVIKLSHPPNTSHPARRRRANISSLGPGLTASIILKASSGLTLWPLLGASTTEDGHLSRWGNIVSPIRPRRRGSCRWRRYCPRPIFPSFTHTAKVTYLNPSSAINQKADGRWLLVAHSQRWHPVGSGFQTGAPSITLRICRRPKS